MKHVKDGPNKVGLIEFTPRILPKHEKYGRLYRPLKFAYSILSFFKREYTKEDRLKIACDCVPPPYFLSRGILIPHPYGITLSADEIGADCEINQNVTIGATGKHRKLGGGSQGL